MAGRGQSKMKFIHKRARWQCNMGTECMWPDVGLALWVLIHILFKPDAGTRVQMCGSGRGCDIEVTFVIVLLTWHTTTNHSSL